MPRYCLSATSVLVGQDQCSCSSSGVIKCCPEECSELDPESIGISTRGRGRSIEPLRAGFVDVHGALDRLDWGERGGLVVSRCLVCGLQEMLRHAAQAN